MSIYDILCLCSVTSAIRRNIGMGRMERDFDIKGRGRYFNFCTSLEPNTNAKDLMLRRRLVNTESDPYSCRLSDHRYRSKSLSATKRRERSFHYTIVEDIAIELVPFRFKVRSD
jgi:hypothetical protein